MNRKRIHSKDSSNRNNAWARPHCCAHANLVAGVVLLWTCLPLWGAPRPLLFEPSKRTPRNAALRSFLVGGSWNCTAIVGGRFFYTFRRDGSLEQLGARGDHSKARYEIRNAQIVIDEDTVLGVLDVENRNSMRLQAGLLGVECRRGPERAAPKKVESAERPPVTEAPGGAIGFKGLLLGEHRDTVVPKLTGLGCRLPEKHKSNLSVHADCDANPVESIALYFHPKTLKLYQIYASFRGLGKGGREVLLETLAKKYGKPQHSGSDSASWEVKPATEIWFRSGISDYLVYADTAARTDAERHSAKKGLDGI